MGARNMNDVVGPDPIARIPSIHRMYAITVGKITTYARTIQKRPVSCPHGTAASLGEETSSRTRLPRKIVHAAVGIAPIRTDSGRDRIDVAAQQMAAPMSAASPHTRPPCPAV
jgi:hypothetical protein